MRTEIRRASARDGTATISTQAALEATNNGELVGWASVFDSPYEISSPWEGDFTEVVRRGAFRGALAREKPVVMYSHGHGPSPIGNLPIARLIEAKEDGTGLFFRAEMFDVPELALLKEGLRSQQIAGASFRFTVSTGQRWSNDRKVREITSFDRVLELGPTIWGANPAASAKLRESLVKAKRATGVDYELAAAIKKMDARIAAKKERDQQAAPVAQPVAPAGYMLVPIPQTPAVAPEPAAPAPAAKREPVMRQWDYERLLGVYRVGGSPMTIIRQLKQRGLSENEALVLESAFRIEAPQLLRKVYRRNSK